MEKRKKLCKCSKKKQKVCKHATVLGCKNVAEVVEALTFQDDIAVRNVGRPCRSSKTCRPPMFGCREPNVIPMSPLLDSRLQYIGHCPPIHTLKGIDSKTRNRYYRGLEESTSEDEPCSLKSCPKRRTCTKKVHYSDNTRGRIELPLPLHTAMHGDDDKEIIHMESPKTSGENIQVQKTTVRPQDHLPPLPANSGHELFKPHSGIIVNGERDFVPDIVTVSGPARSFHSGGSSICNSKSICSKSTCRKRKYNRLARKKTAFRNKSKKGCKTRYKRGTSERVDDGDTCDDIPKPEQIRIPPNLKRGALQTHSLTVLPCTKDRKTELHYGILTGSFNMYDNKFNARSRGRQALPMSVMAYCLAFHYHPKQWTMKLVDNLLEAGDKWYLQCADKVHDHSAVQGMCEVLQFGKKQTLVLNGKRMQVLLGEPDIVGYTMCVDPTVYNLCRGLKAFFKDTRAGIMMTRVLKLVIWKDKVCYYIFDPAGRDNKAYTNFTNGTAALINVKDLESVAEILLARSIIEDQKYVLAPLKCLKMIDEKEDDDLDSDKELTQAEKAMMGYRILNENCAIVNANMHLGDRCFEEAKFLQGLPISVMAMCYAKISPPNTWHTKTLDKILRLGNKLYVDCSNPKVMIDLTIDNIPNEIAIGPYACEIIIYREITKGQMFTAKECLFNIKSGLKDFFNKEYNGGILQFNSYSLGVWRQKEMFYLFDSYPRTSDGLTTSQGGKACVLMLLNPEAMADVLEKNWNYLPVTTQFCIHAFKVLRLKKKDETSHILCSLSDDQLKTKKVKRIVLPEGKARGDLGTQLVHDVTTLESGDKSIAQIDEEHMGEIVSLVDSIQEDYLPPIPLRYKNAPPPIVEDKIVNLDSPTVSVTQIVPPWPKPRDKSRDQPDLDPEPEPEPEPELPASPLPEGYDEEEMEEEEEMERQRIEENKRRLEEDKNKVLELPPPISPPPPTPQEEEPELAYPPVLPDPIPVNEELLEVEPIHVDRKILLPEDAKYRHKLRQQRRKISQPLTETDEDINPEQELLKPSNFKRVLDGSEIIRGVPAINEPDAADILPFTAIMAIVTSYKYSINTWSSGIVNFVQDAAKKLFQNKQEKFQLAPIHVIPNIALGKQAYSVNIDVVGEGPTWRLEDILSNKFFPKHDRGMITTSHYSCGVFLKNGLYYLYDGSPCNGLGLRVLDKGKAAFMRFTKLHELANRIVFNKDGPSDDQQFILSRVVVRKLYKETRMKLPEDYNYETGQTKSKKSRMTVVDDKDAIVDEILEKNNEGYQLIDGIYRIEGSTGLKSRGCGSSDVKACHFISLIAMLMATIHPIRTWNRIMVDTTVEKGIEIFNKAKNLNVCEKRVIKNIIIDGKFINVNIKRLLVENLNRNKTLEQYLKAVLGRLRYVIIRFPQSSMVICQADGYYHLFDPYQAPSSEDRTEPPSESELPSDGVASWMLYRNLNSLIYKIKRTIFRDVNTPEFYTFELTSIKTAPRNFALNYRLSPLFKAEKNPNLSYLKRRRIYPTVDEKMYWLSIDEVPWSRMTAVNDVGFRRKLPQAMWKDWDIEFPGDLYSLWGSLHPKDKIFIEANRGKQFLNVCTVALAVTQCCELSAWTTKVLDGIVLAGDKYYKNTFAKIESKRNLELIPTDLDSKFDEMYPYSFNVKFDKVIFGFMYNIYPDRFNLSKALVYFFEKFDLGILVSPSKNLAFGRVMTQGSMLQSYFMFDCQTFGAPIFVPGQGAAYILKCESLNRLIYCMTITMNIRRHGHQFHLYSANISLTEK